MTGRTFRYTGRMLFAQIAMNLAAFGATAVLAPLSLRFELSLWGSIVLALTQACVCSLLVSVTITVLRLRSHRFALRALSLQSESIEPSDLRALDELPASTTVTFFAVGALASLLIVAPQVRPASLDDGRTASLVVLAITMLSAAAIPHYVLARRSTLRLVELSPIEATTALLEEHGIDVAPRIRRRILVSVAAPVMLVGAGAVLLAHAHLRTFLEESRKATAVVLARSVLDSPPEALGKTADEDAIRAARELGFDATITRVSPTDMDAASAAGVSLSREEGGALTATVRLDESRAAVRFSADLPADVLVPGVLAAFIATLAAAVMGLILGREMARDVDRAASRVRALADQGDLRAGARVSGVGSSPARFDVIQRLEEAIEMLTERFQVFSAAQERALEARETAQRIRGLLFASVSHDLKSPLNAILGFADLLTMEALTDAQAESLDLIRTRGRELLGLIETILDAARVEAGQLKLSPRPVTIDRVLREARRKSLELIGETTAEDWPPDSVRGAAGIRLESDRPLAEMPPESARRPGDGGPDSVRRIAQSSGVVPPIIEIAPELPPILIDPTHGARAVAVILAHALRTTAQDRAALPVRVVVAPATPDRIGIDILYGTREGTAEMAALVGAPGIARARSLILGLALARRIIELHKGNVAVDTMPDGRAVCRVQLPRAPANAPLAPPSTDP